MKCSADVVMACDRSGDVCGFCPQHCPYDDCPVHDKGERVIHMSYKNCTTCRFSDIYTEVMIDMCKKGHRPNNKSNPQCSDWREIPKAFQEMEGEDD